MKNRSVVRLVVDSFAYCLGGSFNFFIYILLTNFTVFKSILFYSILTKFSHPPLPPTAVSDLKDQGLPALKEITRACILLNGNSTKNFLNVAVENACKAM